MHIPGKMNQVADAVSRHPADTPDSDVERFVGEVEDYARQTILLAASDVRQQELRRAQETDEVLQTVI